MNRTMRTIHHRRLTRAAASALAVCGLVLGAGACSDSVEKSAGNGVDEFVDETYEVTYEVTGTGADEIQFHGGGGDAMDPKIEKVSSPALPWKKTVTLRGIMPAAVMPVGSAEGAADITCTITYKGKVIEEVKGEELLTSGGCVAISPITG
ncbi:MmpS family transport accessory protein [Streptomyces sp. NPDC001741]|uniref:MmpS family transport accessory protein n=1 Tax=Streptomyces sp. NPDC001741 TaxID=3364605 RepID=UPI0036B472EA